MCARTHTDLYTHMHRCTHRHTDTHKHGHRHAPTLNANVFMNAQLEVYLTALLEYLVTY